MKNYNLCLFHSNYGMKARLIEKSGFSLSLSLLPSLSLFLSAIQFIFLYILTIIKWRRRFHRRRVVSCLSGFWIARATNMWTSKRERERNRDAPACCDAQLRPSTPLYRRQSFRRERISSSFLHETSHVHVKVHCRAPYHRCRHRCRCRSFDADLSLKKGPFAKLRTGSAKVFHRTDVRTRVHFASCGFVFFF